MQQKKGSEIKGVGVGVGKKIKTINTKDALIRQEEREREREREKERERNAGTSTSHNTHAILQGRNAFVPSIEPPGCIHDETLSHVICLTSPWARLHNENVMYK